PPCAGISCGFPPGPPERPRDGDPAAPGIPGPVRRPVEARADRPGCPGLLGPLGAGPAPLGVGAARSRAAWPVGPAAPAVPAAGPSDGRGRLGRPLAGADRLRPADSLMRPTVPARPVPQAS